MNWPSGNWFVCYVCVWGVGGGGQGLGFLLFLYLFFFGAPSTWACIIGVGCSHITHFVAPASLLPVTSEVDVTQQPPTPVSTPPSGEDHTSAQSLWWHSVMPFSDHRLASCWWQYPQSFVAPDWTGVPSRWQNVPRMPSVLQPGFLTLKAL